MNKHKSSYKKTITDNIVQDKDSSDVSVNLHSRLIKWRASNKEIAPKIREHAAWNANALSVHLSSIFVA